MAPASSRSELSGHRAAQNPQQYKADDQAVSLAPVQLQLKATPAAPFLHQRFQIEFLISIDEHFLENNLLQLFRQELDLPVQLHATWLQGNECAHLYTAAEHETAAAPGTGFLDADSDLSVALEDGRALVQRLPDPSHPQGRYRVYRLTRNYVASCTGPLAFEAARLEYAFANEFRRNAFGQPEALERRQAAVQSERLTIDVRDFPESDRPLAFTDAVGRFSLHAELSSNRISVGESVQLILRIGGEGNLEDFQPSRPESIPGFHVLGLTDSFENGRRMLQYELKAHAPRTQPIEPIHWASFDPGPPAVYRILSSAELPIEVKETRAPKAPGAGQAGPSHPQQSSGFDAESTRWGLWTAAALLAGLAILAWRWLRKSKPNAGL